METLYLPNDIPALCIKARSFPAGVGEAFSQLAAVVPGTGKNYYGISFPDETGTIVYRAAVAAPFESEAIPYPVETFVIRKGWYLTATVLQWKGKEEMIGTTFRKLLADPRLDPSSYCLEQYRGDDEVICMVGIQPPETAPEIR